MSLKANPQLSYSTHSTAPIAANNNSPCRLVSNRLLTAVSGTNGSGSLTYTYDKLGNRLTQVAGDGAATGESFQWL